MCKFLSASDRTLGYLREVVEVRSCTSRIDHLGSKWIVTTWKKATVVTVLYNSLI